MRTHRATALSFSLFAAALLLTCSATTAAHAQGCGPAACAAVFHSLNFESLAPGTSVEGAGAIDPDLIITSVAWPYSPSCTAGTAKVIEEGNAFPFASYGAGASVDNDCLTGARGFGDAPDCVLDYDFTFSPGTSVSCFAIRVLDYGDYLPYGGASHQVLLTAYDAADAVVDTDQILTTGGVDLLAGDACVSQAGSGNVRLVVSGPGIVKVRLRYDEFPDPNVGYDDITFCASTTPTPALPRTWGRLKASYR